MNSFAPDTRADNFVIRSAPAFGEVKRLFTCQRAPLHQPFTAAPPTETGRSANARWITQTRSFKLLDQVFAALRRPAQRTRRAAQMMPKSCVMKTPLTMRSEIAQKNPIAPIPAGDFCNRMRIHGTPAATPGGGSAPSMQFPPLGRAMGRMVVYDGVRMNDTHGQNALMMLAGRKPVVAPFQYVLSLAWQEFIDPASQWQKEFRAVPFVFPRV